MDPSYEEKPGFENIEAADSTAATTNNGIEKEGFSAVAIDPDSLGFTPEEQRRITRQVDRRLVLTVGAMYCVSLMDRTNLGAANIAGMGKELVLIGDRYVRCPPLFPTILLLMFSSTP